MRRLLRRVTEIGSPSVLAGMAYVLMFGEGSDSGDSGDSGASDSGDNAGLAGESMAEEACESVSEAA